LSNLEIRSILTRCRQGAEFDDGWNRACRPSEAHAEFGGGYFFGDTARANLWLRRPLTELGRETPLVVAETEAGANVIEIILGKIAWGAAA